MGSLDSHAAELLSKITADQQFELQYSYRLKSEIDKGQQGSIVGRLDVILYGPKGRADDIGDFLGRSGYYLQDPSGCYRNVPYLNPQCLSSLNGHLKMTFDLCDEQEYHVDEFSRENVDLLADFETTENLAETPTPSALRTELLP